ncbi:hypothetical protein STEG23_022007 [Scotinomys teguina]
MPDLYFYRDPEEIEKEKQAAAEKAVTKEEFQGEWTAPAPEFTAAQPEVADWSKGVQDNGNTHLPEVIRPWISRCLQQKERIYWYQSIQDHCASHFSVAVIKHHDQRQLREDKVVVFLSLSIPILDCHHTWCCCRIPSDFYRATQTWRRQAVDIIKIDKGSFLTRDILIRRGDSSLTSMIIQFELTYTA